MPPYTPPNFDEVNFIIGGDIYTPPNFDEVNFTFGEDNLTYIGDSVKFGDSFSVSITFQYEITSGIKFGDSFTDKFINFRSNINSGISFSDSFSLGNFVLSWTKRIKVLNTEIVSFNVKVIETSTGIILREESVSVTDFNEFNWNFIYTRSMNIADNGLFISTGLTFSVSQVSDLGYISSASYVYV